MTTSERINNLFLNSGKSKRSILQELEFSPTALVEWNKGKSKPTLEAIAKLARYFNVSADYLLCLTDEPKPLENRELKQMDYSVPAIVGKMPDLFKEQRFVNTAKVYNELPDEYRERMYEYIVTVAVNLGINVAKIIGSSRL